MEKGKTAELLAFRLPPSAFVFVLGPEEHCLGKSAKTGNRCQRLLSLTHCEQPDGQSYADPPEDLLLEFEGTSAARTPGCFSPSQKAIYRNLSDSASRHRQNRPMLKYAVQVVYGVCTRVMTQQRTVV